MMERLSTIEQNISAIMNANSEATEATEDIENTNVNSGNLIENDSYNDSDDDSTYEDFEVKRLKRKYSRGDVKFPIFEDSPLTENGEVKDIIELYSTARDWLFQIEIAFSANEIPETAKLAQAVQCLSGFALTWFRIKYEKGNKLLEISWEDFKKLFKNAFFPSTGDYVYYYDYFNWRQGHDMNVATYVMGFKARHQAIESEIPAKYAISKFMWGLKWPIRKYVELNRPLDIKNAYKIAYEGEKIVNYPAVTISSSSSLKSYVLYEFLNSYKKQNKILNKFNNEKGCYKRSKGSYKKKNKHYKKNFHKNNNNNKDN